jgi:type I restriction enzyme S subunit
LNDNSKPFNYWKGPLEDRVVVSKGGVLLAWSGTPGTSFGAHIWEGGRAVLNQHIFRVDFLDQSTVPEWVILAINFRLHVLISKAHGGVGLRHVTKQEVESLEIPIAPVSEQRRIAAILREQIAAVGKARVAAEAQLEGAKALPAACLRGIFQSPKVKKWPKRRLGELAVLLPGRSISSDGDTEVLAITTACLTENGFQPSGVKNARMWACDAAECRVSPGEILVARSNTPELVGRVSLYTGQPPGVVASDLTIRLSTDSQCQAPFLSAYLSFLYITGYWREKAGGASGSMKKITRSQILAEEVPLPELSVQHRIAAELQASGDCAEKIKQAAAEQLAEIERLPASLLRQAFNGEL